ncbi:hypothetical protein NDU88_005018 [Pleurodeles waltl]|uniref:Rx N-terminal domain-containing protein n=1 Tax=Pleurodeles waltl TaxID=8319 RepID=A0AAV7W6P6_PLEWA|nr:hypothetical protein NDU88_005018 [Pleurodeles waltl]
MHLYRETTMTSSQSYEGPVMMAFLETLRKVIVAIKQSIAAVKQEIAADLKNILMDLCKKGQWVDSLEQTTDSRTEGLEEHHLELIELWYKNLELHFQLEDLKNRSHRSNIRIQGVPLQAVLGSLVYHKALELMDQMIHINWTHRVGCPAGSPGQPQNILTCLHYYR